MFFLVSSHVFYYDKLCKQNVKCHLKKYKVFFASSGALSV